MPWCPSRVRFGTVRLRKGKQGCGKCRSTYHKATNLQCHAMRARTHGSALNQVRRTHAHNRQTPTDRQTHSHTHAHAHRHTLERTHTRTHTQTSAHCHGRTRTRCLRMCGCGCPRPARRASVRPRRAPLRCAGSVGRPPGPSAGGRSLVVVVVVVAVVGGGAVVLWWWWSDDRGGADNSFPVTHYLTLKTDGPSTDVWASSASVFSCSASDGGQLRSPSPVVSISSMAAWDR
jgi:hypothetical protein